MPTRRRRKRKQYAWATGVLLVVIVLSMAGVRVHFEAIESSLPFYKTQHLFWKLVLADGQTVKGKMIYETADAITLKTVNGHETWTTPQVISKTTLTQDEMKLELENGIFLEPKETSWVTWRREDSLFHFGSFSGQSISGQSSSGKVPSGLMQGVVASMIGKMPAGSIDEKTKAKVLKAYKSGKLDMNKIQAKMKTMDPKTVEQYRKKAMQGNL